MKLNEIYSRHEITIPYVMDLRQIFKFIKKIPTNRWKGDPFYKLIGVSKQQLYNTSVRSIPLSKNHSLLIIS
jgi:hypothetical protein